MRILQSSRRMPAGTAVITLIGLAVTAGSAAAATARIDVYPPDIKLNTRLARQQVIVVATRDDGVTEDVTTQASLALRNPEAARLEGSVLYPKADGATVLAATYDGKTAHTAVQVAAATADRPISFRLDVMPVFMRAGCNAGGCHGAARGKDGFHLSLFGYDPAGDYFRLTRELGFRRINLAMPRESLLLQKATGSVPHTGGKLFDDRSEYYQTLYRWLEAGAPDDAGEVPQVVDVELFPPQAVIVGPDGTQQMIVRARYSDGTERDVTDWAVYLSNNDNSAEIDPSGIVKAANRGEAFVLARYDTKTVGSQIIVLPAGLKYSPPKEEPANYIDELVGAKLARLRIVPSPLCDDETFLRRVSLDIVGRLPTEEEHAAFLSDKDPQKRARLIDRLLKRKEFAEIWAMKWAELLMIRSTNQVSYKSAYLYFTWLTDQISNNVPVDQMARELLGASGGTFSEPATNFYQVERDTLKTSENVAQVFMGFRIQCAQCHNHPFDRWTMDDYYSFASFFSQIGRKQAEDYRETIVYNRGGGEVRHPVGNRVMKPKFLGGEVPDVQGKDRRKVLAEWLASPENPYFARNFANRIWEHFFGIGIVDPVDDVRVSNPPSNPELLEALGQKLVAYNYDFKRMVRDICNSNAYQRSSRPVAGNESDDRNFARARLRRIRAEILLDCVSQVTETKDKFRGLPLGARAVQIADGTTSTYFLTTFGRSERETVCACEVQTEPTLSQALHLLNGNTIEQKIRAGGAVKKMLDAGKKPTEVIEALYVRSLGRKPTPQELDKLVKLFPEKGSPIQALDDVFWALLNSREFIFNH